MIISRHMEEWYNDKYQVIKTAFENSCSLFWYESENTTWKYTRKQTIAGWILGAIKDVTMKNVVVGMRGRCNVLMYYNFIMSEIVKPELKHDYFKITLATGERISLSNGTTIHFFDMLNPKTIRGVSYNLCIVALHEKDLDSFVEQYKDIILPGLRVKDSFLMTHITCSTHLEEPRNCDYKLTNDFENCADVMTNMTKKRERSKKKQNMDLLMSMPKKMKSDDEK